MIKSYFLSFVISILFFSSVFAQKGTIRGKVYDDKTGEVLLGVTVVIEGTTIGSVTDFDGNFEINADAGTYALQVSYVSYSTLTIQGVEVKAGQVALLDNIRLSEDVEQLEEIVITAQAIRTSEEALLTVKKKSANLLDGISSQSFRKMGDSDAASAVKRVPGVTVEGGKYVFVRGLGDRYTKSTLNGVDIPGLDPDRNTIQMDMFPTSLIDNIVVLKSFTSDLPGDFTGGIVNVETKDFPEEQVFSVSFGGGITPGMHFTEDYLTYAGGKTDFLGFDDGTRSIPTDRSSDIPRYTDVVGRPNGENAQSFRSILDGFNPVMGAMRANSFMDYSMGVNYGNQSTLGKNVIGYNVSVSYKNSTEYFEGAEYGRYGKSDPDVFALEQREYQIGDFGVNNVILSGLAGVALKRERSKYKLNFLHSQNGESKAGIFDYENSDLGANFEAIQHNLEYSERALTNVLLNGTHYSKDSKWLTEWKISPTRSTITDPDIRYTRYRVDGTNLTIGTESGYPERIWRYLEEDNLAGKLDVARDFTMLAAPAKLKFGGGYTYKQRDYEIQNFQIIPQGVDLTGNPDEIMQSDNLWPTNDSGTQGTRYEALFIPNNPNKYEGDISNTAAYVSNEFLPLTGLKAIVGVRMEKYVQQYSGQNQQGLELVDETVLDDLDLFPTVNLIYALTETQNLRFSYSQTIARPSFKEASFAEIIDPLSGRTFIGGFFPDVNSAGQVIWDGNLTATRIDNLDIRWEAFQRMGQTVAASVFYKMFDRPIEIVQYVQAPNNFQPRNVGDGQVLGLELELRQNLGFAGSFFEPLSVNGNFTFISSRIEMSPTEYDSRLLNARDGESVVNTRPMAGQSPYIINAGLSYNGESNGLEAGLFYNVQGETLQFVGIADRPDVYAVPFHSLNLNVNKTFGADDRIRAGFGVNNLLNDVRESVFKSFNAESEVFSRFRPLTSFSLRFSYNF